MSVEAAAMVTVEARVMAAAMAAANATAMEATTTTAVATATATASDSCIEGIHIVDTAAGAITTSTTAVKTAAR
jgi:hypothetical protein